MSINMSIRARQNVDDDLVLIVSINKNIEFEEMKIDNAYVCQNKRPFKGGSFKADALYIAFYHDGAIRAIAKIEYIEDDVDITNNTKIANPCIYLKPSDVDKLRTVIGFRKDSFEEVNIPIGKIVEGKKVNYLQGQWYIKVIKELPQ